MATKPTRERGWNSNLGVILAVAGSAIGFGNYLRFPGLAAQHGGGAFMIAYFVSLFLMGIPLAWVEWSVGRRGGMLGAHSTAGMFMLLMRSHLWKYLGLIGVAVPLYLCMYYLFIESWTFAYTVKTAVGALNLSSAAEFTDAFNSFVGATHDGAAFSFNHNSLLVSLLLAFLANFWVMYKGIGKGIERFCKLSLPVLLITSLLVLVRVLTLGTPDPHHPERSINHGLGYMWNPDKIVLEVRDTNGEWKTEDMLPVSSAADAEAMKKRAITAYGADRIRTRKISLIQGLLDPDVWLAAAGQIFWSLSVCFGTVATYAGYVKRKDDIALSSLTAASANECVEVGIAGMMIVPAAVAILGVSAAAGVSTFGLGFNVLPQVFAQMPAGQLFGTLFFGLLCLAAVTSSISMIQPCIAFLEEFWLLTRKQSVTLVGFFTMTGALIVAWFSRDLMGLDTLDFWFGTVSLYVVGACFLTVFCLKWTKQEAFDAVADGSKIQIPRCSLFIIRRIAPLFLFSVIISWVIQNMVDRVSPPVQNLINGEPGAWIPVLWCLVVFLFLVMAAKTSRRFRAKLREESKRNLHS